MEKTLLEEGIRNFAGNLGNTNKVLAFSLDLVYFQLTFFLFFTIAQLFVRTV